MVRAYGVTLLFGLSLTVMGCSTIINGKHQDVVISSDPGITRVEIDGEQKGTTPLVASLSRGKSHIVKFERDGYDPVELSITHEKYNPWVWGNWITLYLGLFIDAWTGAMYDLSHTRLIANFPTHPTQVANKPVSTLTP